MNHRHVWKAAEAMHIARRIPFLDQIGRRGRKSSLTPELEGVSAPVQRSLVIVNELITDLDVRPDLETALQSLDSFEDDWPTSDWDAETSLRRMHLVIGQSLGPNERGHFHRLGAALFR